MAEKRRATTDLNHENWNYDEVGEDRGSFQIASENELKTRAIKKASRKLGRAFTSNITDNCSSNVFQGLSGFGSSAPIRIVESSFSFLNNLASPFPQSSLTLSNNLSNAEKDIKFSEDQQLPHCHDKSDITCNLKTLNEAFSSWIKKQVDENPMCILSPAFIDYEKYLKEIEIKYQFNYLPDRVLQISTKPEKHIDELQVAEPSPSKHEESKFDNITSTDTCKKLFPQENASENDLKSSSSSRTNYEVSGSGQLDNISAFNSEENENVENLPPEAEFKIVAETDSVYSQKCKVFVKKDGNFVERGVGILYIKPVRESNKVQLLVRANTNLGNILLNFLLSDSMPLKRMGKNNVIIACKPMPNEEPSLVLLRVKTFEEAELLLVNIKKYTD